MKADYKPRPQQLVITKNGGEFTRQYTWKDVAHECYAELSEEGRTEIDNMTEALINGLQARYRGYSSLRLSHEGAREIICALIGGGWW
jgi:hypothetical protein